STITSRLKVSVNPCANWRASTSLPPPGAKGTTIRMTWLLGWAQAGVKDATVRPRAAASAWRREGERSVGTFMMSPWDNWGHRHCRRSGQHEYSTYRFHHLKEKSGLWTSAIYRIS